MITPHELKILSMVKKKTDIIINEEITNDNIVIIDFFNVYCNIVKFNQYKTFSFKTFKMCINLLIKKFKEYKFIIVSKNIFEVSLDTIKELTNENRNMIYIIVEDMILPKSLNKERDDYTCILLQDYLTKKKKKNIILSNDKYRNFYSVLDNTQSFNLKIYNKGCVSELLINNITIKRYNNELRKNKENLETRQFILI